jgi:hypothetical protein
MSFDLDIPSCNDSHRFHGTQLLFRFQRQTRFRLTSFYVAMAVSQVLITMVGAEGAVPSLYPWVVTCAKEGLTFPTPLPVAGTLSDSLLTCMVDYVMTSPFTSDELSLDNLDDEWCFPLSFLSVRSTCHSLSFDIFEPMFHCLEMKDFPEIPSGINFFYDFDEDENSLYDDEGSVFLGSLANTMCVLLDALRAPGGRDCLLDNCFHASVSPSEAPSPLPSYLPSDFPSLSPSGTPSAILSVSPSTTPTLAPSMAPSAQPSSIPSENPSLEPTTMPSVGPSLTASEFPSTYPSLAPSAILAPAPSVTPSMEPSLEPSLTQSPTGLRQGSMTKPIVEVKMLMRILLDGVGDTNFPPSDSFLRALALAFEHIMTPVDGFVSADVVSVDGIQIGSRRLQTDEPVDLLVRTITHRKCLEMDCYDPTLSALIVKEIRAAMIESIESGALEKAIEDQASIHEVPSLADVSPRPDSSNLISYRVEILDETSAYSEGIVSSLSALLFVGQATMVLCMIA